MEIGSVQQIDIDQEMQSAYLDYAMSVIVARALPDVRDGLKPVHRRILYSMFDMGLLPDRPYKKSARVVGDCLGKYHPHGDVAVYEAMARMAQDFSLRYPLVDGQGNFGSIDGDSPASMRYTEVRLAPIALEMLTDINRDTVDFGPNFDNTLTEPLVLPAALPNLLVNGASGIAVGMATNIPPHNLGEVCDALTYLIDRYHRLDDVTVEDLTHFIRGPDFPTGGVVYRYSGRDGDVTDAIVSAYAMGRGRLVVQARVHVEEMSRNRTRLVVTELPYQTNKGRLLERIAELVHDGRLEGLTDLRDESDRQGMRICIELTRNVDPRMILRQLFQLTPLQSTFGLHLLALVNGEPKVLPLKRMLVHYLEHRQEVITRRSRYELERAQARAHILEGLLRALDDIDAVIDTIRRSRTADTARTNLMRNFKLTDMQAQAILDMPLKRLAALERRKIQEEYDELVKRIAHLQDLLAHLDKIRALIREDLLALKARYGDARRTQIADREEGLHTAHDLVEPEEVILTLWQDGQVSRTPKPPRVSSRAVPVCQVLANTRDRAAFFTAGGLAALLPVHQVPDDKNTPLSGLVGTGRDEKPVAVAVLPEEPPPFLTLVTRQGRIKRVSVEDLIASVSRQPQPAIGLDKGDQLGWVFAGQGEGQVLVATRQGRAIRFAEADVRPMGLPAAGVWAIKLGDDDRVLAAAPADDDAFLILLTVKGYGKRVSLSEFPVQGRYGNGVVATKLTAGSGPVAVATVAAEGDQLVLLDTAGSVTQLPVVALHKLSRTSQGYKSRQDDKTPYLDPKKKTDLTALIPLPAADTPDEPPKKPRSRSKSQKTTKVESAPATPPASSRRSKQPADEARPASPSRRRGRGTAGQAEPTATPPPSTQAPPRGKNSKE